jgi:hypothetical protein
MRADPRETKGALPPWTPRWGLEAPDPRSLPCLLKNCRSRAARPGGGPGGRAPWSYVGHPS